MMLESLNYQSIIELVSIMIAVSLPIGIVFGLSVKLVNLFISMVFGERNIKL